MGSHKFTDEFSWSWRFFHLFLFYFHCISRTYLVDSFQIGLCLIVFVLFHLATFFFCWFANLQKPKWYIMNRAKNYPSTAKPFFIVVTVVRYMNIVQRKKHNTQIVEYYLHWVLQCAKTKEKKTLINSIWNGTHHQPIHIETDETNMKKFSNGEWVRMVWGGSGWLSGVFGFKLSGFPKLFYSLDKDG